MKINKEITGPHWALINKVIEITGYSDDAIRAKKKRGEWLEGIHWRKAPDNRVVFDLSAINRWMGGSHA
ncbi:excisionase [Pseudoduganella sp. DS3]|uniref:Excisionase n=1 Tax=Pseudoduganella guangdongensis TaxID=2692179 RepID=A0A6N9HPB2_9BURK|nr:excisionase [Pseudoduganella guangdongensis]MYN05370.1 excisionase [Pseudoduganella guangdongensis]